jgi:hypothetical protein
MLAEGIMSISADLAKRLIDAGVPPAQAYLHAEIAQDLLHLQERRVASIENTIVVNEIKHWIVRLAVLLVVVVIVESVVIAMTVQ